MNGFDLNKYLKELELLVNMDSGSKDPDGIKEVASFFESLYKEMGWSVKIHDFDSSVGPCLEIRNMDQEEIDILLIGHMDTVFPKGTAKERSFAVKEDKAYGPGVIDMKSGLLSMYYGLRSLELYNLEKQPSICVALNSDEEISSKFSNRWIQELAKKSKYALVLEPARKNGEMVNERKGILKYGIDFTGVAAHAGVEPEKGISAITELGHWIVELNKLNDFKLGTTINVGLVSGGTAPNVVAQNANCVVDIRFKSDDEMKKVEEGIQKLLENPKLPGIKVEAKRLGFRPPMNPTPECKRLHKIIEEIGTKLDMNIEWIGTGGGSDANFTAALGIPTVDTLGPMGGGAHGIDEYLDIKSIEPRLNLLREFMIELLNIK